MHINNAWHTIHPNQDLIHDTGFTVRFVHNILGEKMIKENVTTKKMQHLLLEYIVYNNNIYILYTIYSKSWNCSVEMSGQ